MHPEQYQVRFEVKDTGIGIEESSQAEIFEYFVQRDGSSTRKHGGTGLGLTIVRELVNMMGGQVSVRSRPGEGATFSFTATFGVAKEAELETSRLEKKRVLIVDDNHTNCQIVQNYLASWGIDAPCNP